MLDTETVLLKCRELRRNRQDEEAIELLSTALATTRDERLFYERGRHYELIDQYNEALNDYSQAIDLAPECKLYRLCRGLLLAEAFNRSEDAMPDLKKVLDLDPNCVEAHQNLSQCLALTGNPELSLVHANRAIDLAPTDAVSYFCAGEALLAADRNDEAEKSLAMAVQLDDRAGHYWGALGNAQYRAGKLAAAYESYRRACSLDPSSVSYRTCLARVELESGDKQRAAANLKIALDLGPDEVQRFIIEHYLMPQITNEGI